MSTSKLLVCRTTPKFGVKVIIAANEVLHPINRAIMESDGISNILLLTKHL